MKSYVIIFLSFFLLISCEKENENVISKEDLLGKWINTLNKLDTLYFTDSLLYRTHFRAFDSGFHHFYNYKLKVDSIELEYLGLDKIGIFYPFVNRINLTSKKERIIIEDFKRVYPAYNGDEFDKMTN